MPDLPLGNKRKQAPNNTNNGRQNKRAKVRDARTIATQATYTAFKDGEINVDKFVKARQYEIKALEDGMVRAKKSLTTRAFQGVPRELRRRTASHNVKKVPKRLRARAGREMVEDNTPTVTARRRKLTGHMRLRLENVKRIQKLAAKAKARSKGRKQTADPMDADVPERIRSKDVVRTRTPRVKPNSPKNPPTPPAKFRKRQLHKSWLPTHMFHTKRAHLTPPKEPLWRFAVPLAPTMKCYRPTHRASTARGAVAWDMSYMSTIGVEGTEAGIEGLLKTMGVGADGDPEGIWEKKGRKWRNGTVAWEGWLFERHGWPAKGIAPVTIIWCAAAEGEDVEMKDVGNGGSKRKALVRVHPSAFLELWEEMLRNSKMQKPAVKVEDMRFEIGSIEITGPAATEALVGALWPVAPDEASTLSPDAPESVWKRLAQVTNLNVLPANALLGFNISDPRLHHPPRTVELDHSQAFQSELVTTLAEWPPNKTQKAPQFFDRSARLAAARSLPSQKAINRRKSIATPGQFPDPKPTDPKIPVLLYATRGTSISQGIWTVLLPWKFVNPVWYSIIYYPLSTGGNTRFGGLEQKRQLAFEAGVPWFPGDFPGTSAGMAWEAMESTKRKHDWEKRPKGKRVEWESLKLGEGRKGEVGAGWACDWDHLLKGTMTSEYGSEKVTPYHLPSTVAARILSPSPEEPAPTLQPGALATVTITLITRGLPTTCARVYRLPTTNAALRSKWISLLPSPRSKSRAGQRKPKHQPAPPKDAPSHIRQQHLSKLILDPASLPQPGDARYPDVPGEEDLVGFVTAGNYNLGEGKGTGVGSLLLSKVITKEAPAEESRLCIVRDAGEEVGRLARWELVG
ncbi:ribonuclease P complex subunit Pop1 [Saccharata proteae CBS 121410]|uniref:Ribonuclease P complex subunit Pop1 n=1 Tax=Saccharata proteae CBS 121410 TaxID=1314787 RepID=A0A9P4HKH4_9PEZI|nr:ribonuclease P complex subunit Pop1 [Saccharata proteae CBS 121410]